MSARARSKAGAMADRDITDDIIRAVDELHRLRSEGMTVAELLAQSQMFPDLNKETIALLQFLDANMKAPARIAAFVEAYLGELEAFDSPNQNDMFGAVEAPDRATLIGKAKEKIGDEQAQPDATVQSGKSEGGEPAGKPAGETGAARASEVPEPAAAGDKGKNCAVARRTAAFRLSALPNAGRGKYEYT